ncbi:MAG: hypothetical protein ACLSAH_04290 [Bilophila wadsworthia]
MPAIAAMVVFPLQHHRQYFYRARRRSAGHFGLAITFPVMNLTFALVLLVGIGGASICSSGWGNRTSTALPRARQRPAARPHQRATFGLLSQLVLDPVLTAFGASEHLALCAISCRSFCTACRSPVPCSGSATSCGPRGIRKKPCFPPC